MIIFVMILRTTKGTRTPWLRKTGLSLNHLVHFVSTSLVARFDLKRS